MRAYHNPYTIAAPFAHYSHGLSVPADWRLLATSGQLGVSADGDVPDDAEKQAEICFSNIAAILADAGMTADAVLRINGYLTDRAYFPAYMRARDRFIGAHRPASTLLIVGGFTRPEFMVEVEVLAAAP